MSSLVILFIVIVGVIIPLNDVNGAEYPSLDINTILDLVQSQQSKNTGIRKERNQQVRHDSYDSSDYDSTSDDSSSETNDSDDTDNNRVARLRKDKIIDLIEKVANEKNNRIQNDHKIYNEKPNYAQNNNAARNEKYDNSKRSKSLQTQVLEELLNRGMNNEDRKIKPRADYYKKKRLKPNPLTGNILPNELKKSYRNDDAKGLEDYSKVYIVLNPQAVQKSKNKNSLNDLISKVLALSSPPSKKDHQRKRRPKRYKGFLVKDDLLSRRSRRESREVMHDEYKHNRKGNAGGTGGRTAIPHIKYKGDIYERDD